MGWVKELNRSRTERGCRENPQFEECLRLLLPSKDVTAVVEVFNDPHARKKMHLPADGLVGKFELQLGSEEAVTSKGGFDLQEGLVEKYNVTGTAKLFGTFTLWRLERA